MPAIVRDFNSSIGSIQSILVLFSLIMASFAPTTENLCRFYGRTRVFFTGLTLYGIGITLTTLSPTIGLMAISFAVLTGLAATPLISTPWTIADLAYEGKAEEQAAVLLIVASALGSLSGALLGGYIAFNVGWRWAFVPSLGVLLLIFRFQRSLPKLLVRCEQPIDWMGGLLSFLGLGSILTGISLAGEFGWWEPRRIFAVAGVVLPPFALSIVPTLIAVGVILLGLFIFWQRRQANRSLASVFRVGLLRKPRFVLGMFTAMLHTMVTAGLQFNLYQFLPIVLALNPFQTALTVIPYNVTMIISIVVVLKLLTLERRFPPKYIIYSGLILLATGIGWLYRCMHLRVTSLELMPGLIIMGVGSGLFLAYISRLTYAATLPEEKPEGSGIYNPIQNLGNSLGRGILGTTLVYFASRDIVDGVLQQLGKSIEPAQRSQLIAELQGVIQTLSKAEVRSAIAAQVSPSIRPLLQSIGLEAATSAMRSSLLVALIVTGVCFLLATTLPKRPSRLS